MHPLVSIVIPTHRPKHFRTALMCAMSQTYKNKEIIVSDNSDGMEIANICAQHEAVIYRRNSNRKPSSNIAQPLLLAGGDYIKYLFDDDLIYPNCIDSMVGWLGQFSDANINSIGLVTSARHLINDDSVCYAEVLEKEIVNSSMINGEQVAKRILVTQDNFVGEFSTVLFKREFVDLVDPESIYKVFGEDFSYGLVDVPLYISILQRANMLYIPYSLSAFRKHTAGGSNVSENPGFHYVVSDWFRLANAAYRNGYLSKDEARVSVGNYLNLAKHFEDVFPEQLAPWRMAAMDFIEELDQS